MSSRKKNNNNNDSSDDDRATPSYLFNRNHGRVPSNFLALPDQYLLEGEHVAKNKLCSAMSVMKAAREKLLHAIGAYERWLDMDIAAQDSNYAKVQKSYDDALTYAMLIHENISNCEMQQNYPGIGDAINLNNRVSGNAPDDVAIRNKIKSAQLTNPCGFRSFDDYAGGKDFEEFFNKAAVYPFIYKNIGNELNKKKGTCIMLVGPPGTGKTLLAEATAEKLQNRGSVFFSIATSDIKGKFVGESEKSIKFLFEEARAATQGGKVPVVLFLDEYDGLLDDTAGGSGLGTGLLSQMNQELDGLNNNSNKGLIFITATNFPEKIPDSALSRLQKIYVGLPSLSNIRELLVKKINKMGHARYNMNVDYTEPGKIRMQFIDEINWASQEERATHFDDIDLMSIYLYDRNAPIKQRNAERAARGEPLEEYTPAPYAPREIDTIFDNMLLDAAYRSVKFVTSQNTTGENYQKWIVDKSEFEVREKDGRACRLEKHVRHSMIPIGIWTETEGNDTLGSILNSDHTSKTDPKNGIRQVVTLRSLNKVSKVWEYKIVAEENEAGQIIWQNTDNIENLPVVKNFASYLGISQITFADFERNLELVKPVFIKNAKKLYEFVEQSAQSFKKGKEDILRLKELADMQSKTSGADMEDLNNAMKAIVLNLGTLAKNLPTAVSV